MREECLKDPSGRRAGLWFWSGVTLLSISASLWQIVIFGAAIGIRIDVVSVITGLVTYLHSRSIRYILRETIKKISERGFAKGTQSLKPQVYLASGVLLSLGAVFVVSYLLTVDISLLILVMLAWGSLGQFLLYFWYKRTKMQELERETACRSFV